MRYFYITADELYNKCDLLSEPLDCEPEDVIVVREDACLIHDYTNKLMEGWPYPTPSGFLGFFDSVWEQLPAEEQHESAL